MASPQTAADALLDLKESKLRLDGTDKEREEFSLKCGEYYRDLQSDASTRRSVNTKRKDFYEGNQGSYSNITGLLRDTKQQKGHVNQVVNYAGKTVVKISYGMANNPPKLSVPGLDPSDGVESAKAQAVEDYIGSIFDNRINHFWKKTYRRGCFIQTAYGDFGIRTYVQEKDIKLVGHDNTSSLMVGWNNVDPDEFDFVISENYYTADAIEDQFGIKVNRKGLTNSSKDSATSGSWDTDPWGTKSRPTVGKSSLPTGKTDLAKLKVIDYDSADIYAIKIEDKLVQYIKKDDEKFPRVKFWTIVKNIPNPPSPWSIADIDYLTDIQVELNDNDNRTADYIRVGGVQRYVTYNMKDFNAESLRTHSGQVISIEDPTGTAKIEPLPTNMNNFPADQYGSRKQNQMYDMGLPKVNYGSSGADSGRAKAIDYQSSVDVTVFKRDAWELALQDICEKIQIFGNFLLGETVDWFTDEEGDFVLRRVEFDWTDILPLTATDKIVNIANKVNMIGIPLKQALTELGYRNADQQIAMLKQELENPQLMILRSKMWQLSQGLSEATKKIQEDQMAGTPQEAGAPEGNGVPAPSPNQSFPVLSSSQNTKESKPMIQKGGTTSFSTPAGFIARTRQNLTAQGKM